MPVIVNVLVESGKGSVAVGARCRNLTRKII